MFLVLLQSHKETCSTLTKKANQTVSVLVWLHFRGFFEINVQTVKIFFTVCVKGRDCLIFLLQNILPLLGDFTTLPVVGFFPQKKSLNDCSLTRQLLESRLIFTLMISETSPSTSLSANLLVELRLLAVCLKRPFPCK